MTSQSHIYLGIGGWTFAPWRGEFYPKGLPHAKELSYASERLTSIEVNGTFYRTQSPATYRKWASEVPDGFVFSIKGSRYVTNRRVLSEAGESIERFLNSDRNAISGNLPEVGERGAGRLRVFHQGFALRHQPPRAERSRRIDRTISQFRSERNLRQPTGSGRARCRTASCFPSRVRATSPTAAC